MDVRTRFCGVAGLALGMLMPVVARGGSFDSQLEGRMAEQVIGEAAPATLDGIIHVDAGTGAEHVMPPIPPGTAGDVIVSQMPGDRAAASVDHEPSTAWGTGGPSTVPSKALLLPVWPRWEAQIDALMLWQGNIQSRVLYTDAATGASALNVNQADTPMTAGVRYGLFLNLDPVYSIEGNYFDVQSFGGAAATPAGLYAQNNLAAPSIGPAEGVNFTSANVATSGAIKSAELNWRRRTGTPITWLAGFRWVEWNQRLAVNDTFTFDSATELPPGTSSLDVATGNDLYGGQVGMDLCLVNRSRGAFMVNGIGKAGLFYNRSAYQRTSGVFALDGEPPFPLGPVAATADQTAFVGEVGANATLRLTDWLAWRAGYTVFWLSGVATPANQLSVTDVFASPPTATINTNGSVLLHGVTTGLEARW